MVAKTFEILDRATFLPVLAVQLKPDCERDRYILARAGYGRTPQDQGAYIQLIAITGGHGKSACDPYDWGDRTYKAAHRYIIEHWNELQSGAVVDVQFILGETAAPKESEEAIYG